MKLLNQIYLTLICLGLTVLNNAYAQCDSLDFTLSYSSTADDALIEGDQICFGEAITAEATSVNDGTITWEPALPNGVEFVPETTGTVTYTATSSDPADCPHEFEIFIHELPIAHLTATPDTICNGDSVQVDLVIIDGESPVFDPDPLYADLELGVPVLEFSFTEVVTGQITEVVTGCVIDASVEIFVRPWVTFTTEHPDSIICPGEEISLTGVGLYDFDWDVVEDGEPFEIFESQEFMVTATDSLGCQETNYVSVEVFESELWINVVDSLICEGEEVILTGEGMDEYTWSDGVTDGDPFYPLDDAVYQVVGVDLASGCQDSTTIEITVDHDIPTIEITVDEDEICYGESVVFSATGADSIFWSDESISIGEPFIIGTVGMATFNAFGLNDGGACQGSSSIEVLVHANPDVEGLVEGGMEYCEGDTITLYGTGADEYSWSDEVEDGVAFVPDETGTLVYSVVGTDLETGCSKLDYVAVFYHALPTVEAMVSDSNICYGQEVVFYGEGAETYNWSDGLVDGEPIILLEDGIKTYYLEGISEDGCENFDSVEVFFNTEIIGSYTSTSELLGADASIDLEVTGGTPSYSYDWNIDGTGDFDDDEDVFGLSAGDYSVVILDEKECTDTLVILIDDLTGIISKSESQPFQVYPNPASSQVTVSSSIPLNGQQVILRNLQGQIVFVSDGLGNSNQLFLNLSHFESGLYILSVQDRHSNELFSTKLLLH